MNHDGTRSGYPCDAYARLASLLHVPVIASGGAGSARDIAEVLTVGGADAALAASIFHYGELTVNQLKKQLQAENISVRL
jgi:cyclase